MVQRVVLMCGAVLPEELVKEDVAKEAGLSLEEVQKKKKRKTPTQK